MPATKAQLVKTNFLKPIDNTQTDVATRRRGFALGPRLVLFSVAVCVSAPGIARAVLPEPDNILYGTIALDGRPIGAGDSNISIQARRTPTGPPIAQYQMGTDPRAGNFYSLRIPLESITPKTDADATLTGDAIYIVVTEFNEDREVRPYTVGQRGAFSRIDIGTALPDSDGDGLLDAWELAMFGNLAQGPNGDPDGDGQTNLEEYLAGTNPAGAGSALQLTIASQENQIVTSFLAVKAQGPGYEGFTRRYSLQYSTNLGAGLWLDVPNYTNLVGNDATITYQSPANSSRFFRGKVWLEAP
jgi:hypothetical protein